MPHVEEQPHSEQKIAIVGAWLSQIENTGEVSSIDVDVLKGALEELGANFEITEEAKDSLGSYTNKDKALGMTSVWGDTFEAYKDWTEDYVSEYESEHNFRLPALKKSKSKTSGMRHFLGELTAFAAGEMSFEDYKKFTEARLLNGLKWAEGKPEERVRVQIPGKTGTGTMIASIPPMFISKAWDQITGRTSSN